MKKLFKAMASVFGLGAVILVLLHLFLLHGLTNAMRKVVLPRIHEQTGIEVVVDDLSINIPHGLMYLKGVEVRNPEGFKTENAASIAEIVLKLDVPSLLRGRMVRINEVTIGQSVVNAVRNVEGEINLVLLQAALPKAESAEPSGETPDDDSGGALPIPEMLIDALRCQTVVRYLDEGNERIDYSLDLLLTGASVGTHAEPGGDWGHLDLAGSLGSDRTRFVTDLHLALAPVVDPQSPSFDLTGKVLEIDPRIMEKIYDSLGVRSAPFGFEPQIRCRNGRFEESMFALELKNIQFEDKLADKLGGVASIESLRFPVPVAGTVQKPSVDVKRSFALSLSGNSRTLLESVLSGVASEQLEIDGDDTKRLLEGLGMGGSSKTNASASTVTDVLVDILGDKVDEVGENALLKDGLKSLGRKLFGD